MGGGGVKLSAEVASTNGATEGIVLVRQRGGMGGWVGGWAAVWAAGWLGGWLAGRLGGCAAGWVCGGVGGWVAGRLGCNDTHSQPAGSSQPASQPAGRPDGDDTLRRNGSRDVNGCARQRADSGGGGGGGRRVGAAAGGPWQLEREAAQEVRRAWEAAQGHDALVGFASNRAGACAQFEPVCDGSRGFGRQHSGGALRAPRADAHQSAAARFGIGALPEIVVLLRGQKGGTAGVHARSVAASSPAGRGPSSSEPEVASTSS